MAAYHPFKKIIDIYIQIQIFTVRSFWKAVTNIKMVNVSVKKLQLWEYLLKYII